MLLSLVLFLSLGCSLIFNGTIENLFIVLAALAFYKQVIIDRNYKKLAYALFISFLVLNFSITFIFRDYFPKENADPVVDKKETLVMLVSEGENKNYKVRERATQIYFEEGYKSLYNGLSNLHNYKKYYNKLGQSDFKHNAFEISEKLRYRLDENYMVVNSYLYSKPYFENMMEIVLQEGYKRIIICPIFMTEGIDYQNFMQEYNKMHLASRNIVDIDILEPLYKSEDLAKVYSESILKDIKNFKNDAGVLLIGLQHKNNLEQDVKFREMVKAELEKGKVENDLDLEVRMPLLENNENDIIKSAEELLEYGINSLYVLAPTSTIDTMYTRNLVSSVFEALDLGDTKFHYLTPSEKNDAIVNSIFYNILEKQNT